MSNIRFQGNPSGTGTLTIASPNTNSDFTLNLPTANGTIPLLATVTNNGVMFINGSGQPTTGTALTFDGTNLGVGTSSTTVGYRLDVRGNVIAYTASGNVGVVVASGTDANGAINAIPGTGLNINTDATNRNITFSTNSTERMRLDASGRLMLGTTTQQGQLTIASNGASQNAIAFIETQGAGRTFITGPGVGTGTVGDFGFYDLTGSQIAYIYTAGASGKWAWYTNGSERARIASNGDLTLKAGGSANITHAFYYNENGGEIQLMNASGNADVLFDSVNGLGRYYTFNGGMSVGALGAHTLAFITSGVERARIASTGQMSTTTGTGSLALAYDARAWVNFNGTGTVAIRASGNVSSITDNGTGDYTVNFSTAMPDANFSVAATSSDITVAVGATSLFACDGTFTTGSVRVRSTFSTANANGARDSENCSVEIFR